LGPNLSSNLIPPYQRTTQTTSSRQPTVPATTATSAGAQPRSPATVPTEGRSGVGGSSDGQDEQSRIVQPPETGEQPPSLSSGLSHAPWLNRRRPGSPLVSLLLVLLLLLRALPVGLRRPLVCMYLLMMMMSFICSCRNTAVPITKLFAWGEGDSGGHVLRETTSRGLCGLVCPSQQLVS
jgi:hypothetical protein